MQIHNRTKIKIKGFNQEKLLNELSNKISIYNYKRISHGESEFEIDYKNRKTVKKILNSKNYEILHIRNIGILNFLKSIFTRYGIFVGLVVVAILQIFQYSFIWKVKVYGQDSLQSEQIQSYIEKNLTSKYKNNIDTKNLEQIIKNEFEFVSSISIAIIGQSLVVNFNETILPPEMDNEFEPIVSDFDGLITEINLVQGTLNCKKGDIVHKGDILVYPYIVDADGNQRALQPKAEIKAKVWYKSNVNFYEYRIVTERTGKVLVENNVYIGNLLLYNYNQKNNFEQYEVEKEINELSKNLILPLKLEKIYYYETVTREIVENFENVKEEIISQAREKALINLQEDDIIEDENYFITQNAGVYIVNYTICVEKTLISNL